MGKYLIISDLSLTRSMACIGRVESLTHLRRSLVAMTQSLPNPDHIPQAEGSVYVEFTLKNHRSLRTLCQRSLILSARTSGIPYAPVDTPQERHCGRLRQATAGLAAVGGAKWDQPRLSRSFYDFQTKHGHRSARNSRS